MAPGALIDYNSRDGAALETTSDNIDAVNYLKGLPAQTEDNDLHAVSHFDSEKDKTQFRQYDEACDRVKTFYKEQHEKQTVAYNLWVRNQYQAREKHEMTVWEAMEKLNTLIDESDPDTELGQIQHLLQAAEAMRKDGRPRWMQVTGLIHDLGKLLFFYGSQGQWDVVGDTFPVGCAFDERNIYPETFTGNPDHSDPIYSTKHGIYAPNCGLENVMLSWGHDEYLYHVVKNQSTLPREALAMIRYHSFYPWHKEGAYRHLMNEEDEEALKAVKAFNPYDLYSKSDGVPDVDELKPYYMELIDEFFPQKVIKCFTLQPTPHPRRPRLNVHRPNRRVNTLGAEEITENPSFAERSVRITWAWFAVNVSTGSVASLLANLPYSFTGLRTIGKIFFIVNLLLYLGFVALIIARFIRRPRALSTSLHHPSESFYFGAFWVATGLIILGIQAYGVPECGPWLVKAMRVLFWWYFGCALCVAIFQYHVIFHEEKLTVSDAMPAWVFPAYPFLLTGVLAANVAEKQPADSALQILVAGICGQGLGWILAFFIYTVYLTRLINSKMPSASVRPGMYISVGPAAFTCAGLLALGKNAKEIIPEGYLGITSFPVGDLWLAFSVPAALFLWLLAVWFTALSSLSVFRAAYKMSFSLSWWSFVFPNAGLALATGSIGEAIDSRAFRIGGCVIAGIIIPFWFIAAAGNIHAVWTHRLLYPGTDAGVDDVNWAHHAKKRASADRREGRRGNRQWTLKMLKEKRAAGADE